MNRLQTILTLSMTLVCGSMAQAQHCENGACSRKLHTNTAAPATTHYDASAPSGYGYSQFRPSTDFRGQTMSFSRACSGSQHSSSYGPERPYGNDVARDRYAPMNGDRYVPMNRARSGDYFGSDYIGRYDSGRGDFSNSGRNRPQVDDRRYSPGGYTPRGYSPREYTPRQSAPSNYTPGQRYPSNNPGYGYTSTRPDPRSQVKWHTDLRQASRLVQESRRPMLVSVTADWCSHCTRMKNETFNDARFMQSLTASGYVPVRLDADSNRELVSKIGIQSLPTTLIVTPDLQIRERLRGFQSADTLTQSLRKHMRNAKAETGVKVAAR